MEETISESKMAQPPDSVTRHCRTRTAVFVQLPRTPLEGCGESWGA